jgi:hypothetical protein
MRLLLRYLVLLLAPAVVSVAAALCGAGLVLALDDSFGPGIKNAVVVCTVLVAITGAAVLGRWSGRRFGGAEWSAPAAIVVGMAATLLLLVPGTPLRDLPAVTAPALLAWSGGMTAVAAVVARLGRRGRSRAAAAWATLGGFAVAELAMIVAVVLLYPPSVAPRAYALLWLPVTAFNVPVDMGRDDVGMSAAFHIGDALEELPPVLLVITVLAATHVCWSTIAARRAGALTAPPPAAAATGTATG